MDLPTPLRLSFVFAELNSLEPLRQLVSKDVLHLTGQLFILVQLNTIEAAVMRSRQVVLPFNVDQTIATHAFSAEPMIQSAVLKLLDTYPRLTRPVRPPWPGSARKDWCGPLRQGRRGGKGVSSLLRLFFTQPQTHDVQRYAQSGTAFLIDAEGTLLTAKRVVQPWNLTPGIVH